MAGRIKSSELSARPAKDIPEPDRMPDRPAALPNDPTDAFENRPAPWPPAILDNYIAAPAPLPSFSVSELERYVDRTPLDEEQKTLLLQSSGLRPEALRTRSFAQLSQLKQIFSRSQFAQDKDQLQGQLVSAKNTVLANIAREMQRKQDLTNKLMLAPITTSFSYHLSQELPGLLKDNFDVNLPVSASSDRNGELPLVRCLAERYHTKEAERPQQRLVRALLRAGADPNALSRGETALNKVAKGSASPDLIHLLLLHKADPNLHHPLRSILTRPEFFRQTGSPWYRNEGFQTHKNGYKIDWAPIADDLVAHGANVFDIDWFKPDAIKQWHGTSASPEDLYARNHLAAIRWYLTRPELAPKGAQIDGVAAFLNSALREPLSDEQKALAVDALRLLAPHADSVAKVMMQLPDQHDIRQRYIDQLMEVFSTQPPATDIQIALAKLGLGTVRLSSEGLGNLDYVAKLPAATRQAVFDAFKKQGLLSLLTGSDGDTYLHQLIQKDSPNVDEIANAIRYGFDPYQANDQGISTADWIMGSAETHSTSRVSRWRGDSLSGAHTLTDAQKSTLINAMRDYADQQNLQSGRMDQATLDFLKGNNKRRPK